MKKYAISFVAPSIRSYNWRSVYESIVNATSESFEIIFVGPCGFPSDLTGFRNIKTIRDFGSPVRCLQIAILNASGEHVSWIADDGVFLPNAIDNVLSQLLLINHEKKGINCKHFEGVNRDKIDIGENDHIHSSEWYWNFSGHDELKFLGVPNYWKLSPGFMKTELLKSVGGFDCRFETVAYANMDFALRIQRFGCVVECSTSVVSKYNWMPGTTGDHEPMHNATAKDKELFRSISADPNRVWVNPKNWIDAESVWAYRF